MVFRLVIKIMEYCDIDLRGEPKKKMSSKECEITIGAVEKNMGIFNYKDGLFKHRDITPSSSSAPPIPEDGYTKKDLYNKTWSIEILLTIIFCNIHLQIDQLKHQKKEEESEDKDMEEDESD